MPTSGEVAALAALAGSLRHLARELQQLERAQAKEWGFTTSQCRVVLELADAGSLPMRELVERLQLESSTVTRIVDNLVRDGLLRRAREQRDRRLVLVQLTERGQASAAALEAAIAGCYRRFLQRLPGSSVQQVVASVRLVRTALEGRPEAG